MPKFLRKPPNRIPGIIRKILLSWLVSITVGYSLLPSELRDLTQLACLAQTSLGLIVGITGGLTVLLLATSHFANTERLERWGFPAVFAVLSFTALNGSFTTAFLLTCIAVMAVLVVYALLGWNHAAETVPTVHKCPKLYIWVTVGLSALFFLFVCAWTVGRIYCFATPTYDFGIFSQMFYSMRESGTPMTTVERDGLLSHFAVHVSPIYYLMLPFYCLFPTPATLQVLQAAVITSAIIPLWKLAKHRGLSGLGCTLVCAVLLLYPAFSGGTSYDIHENCFLTPLILWLLYGIDKKNTAITAISALLTLAVKEDAATYVAIVGLWLTVKTCLQFKRGSIKDLLTGIGLLAVSLGWFFAVTGYLAEHGDGVMTYRYKNFMYDGSSSLVTVVKAVLINPMKAIFECVDTEKLRFIMLTLFPLMGLPLITRRYERYILLIPYILINLMSDYQYQHNIFFQYTFGSTAFLLYLTVVNLADLKFDRHRVIALLAAVVMSATYFCSTVLPKAMLYPTYSVRNYAFYESIRDTLDSVPEDASVAATTFYTTHLSKREVLYDVRYCSKAHLLEAEYVVLNVTSTADYQKYNTGGQTNGFDNLVRLLERNGYTLYQTLDNVLVIYHRDLQN